MPVSPELLAELESLGFDNDSIVNLVEAAKRQGVVTDEGILAWVRAALEKVKTSYESEVAVSPLTLAHVAGTDHFQPTLDQLRDQEPAVVDSEELRRRMELMGLSEQEMQQVMTWALQAQATDPDRILHFARMIHVIPMQADRAQIVPAKTKRRSMWATISIIAIILLLIGLGIFTETPPIGSREWWVNLVKAAVAVVILVLIVVMFISAVIDLVRDARKASGQDQPRK